MAVATPIPAPTHRHASGETDGCCDACVLAEGFVSEEEGRAVFCIDARPDPDAPGFCSHCSHTIEEVPA